MGKGEVGRYVGEFMVLMPIFFAMFFEFLSLR